MYFEDQSESQNQTHKVQFMLIGTMPQDPREFCRLFCCACKKSFSYASFNTEGNSDFNMQCPSCESVGVPVWQVTLLVKDKESIGSDHFFKLNFFTHFIELNPQKSLNEVLSLGLVDLEE